MLQRNGVIVAWASAWILRSFSRKERGFQDDKGSRGWVETEPMLEDG